MDDTAWYEIGNRIKTLRTQRNLTQKEFGIIINKSTQYIGRIERGQKISVELISCICQNMNASADYLIFGISDSNENFDFISDFSSEQIELCFDILKKVTVLMRTPKGNTLLLRELAQQQYTLDAV